MKTKIVSILLCLIILLSGCKTSGGNKTSFSYPSDIKAMCENARNDAMACINGNGTKVAAKKSIILEKRQNCIKKYGMWAWQEPTAGNAWVVGATWKRGNGFYIQVACNPKTGGEVRYQTVKHEHGHYFLWSNYGDSSHNPKYGSCFENWNGVKIVAKSFNVNGEDVIFDCIVEEPGS